MPEEIDRAEERLQNIQSVEPILSALRTISHGSWQNSRRRLKEVHQYNRRLMGLVSEVLPHVKAPPPDSVTGLSEVTCEKMILLLVGSERGLCGRFHIDLIDNLETFLIEQEQAGIEIDLWILGSRLKRRLDRRGHAVARFQRASLSGIPDFNTAYRLLSELLVEYESGSVMKVHLLHNILETDLRSRPHLSQFIPPVFQQNSMGADLMSWPPPIIETDPNQLYQKLLEQQLATRFLQSLLESAVAEHSIRFHLMEEATKNAERLIDELNSMVQLANRQAITREMEELAAGSGLLKMDR